MDHWAFAVAVMTAAGGAIRDRREVWRMRLDEAVGLCEGRKRLLEAAGRPRTGNGGGREVERRPDGTTVVSINSTDKLRSFLQTGRA